MVREGLFNDVDVALHWHPGSVNHANPRTSNSNKSAKFTFNGISAHAAGSPDKGRSALDGVESMNMMVNLMREHIPQESRIHYVITKGGLAPNVVPDVAEVYYYIRHPKIQMVNELFGRVVKAAEGAAMGTDTSVSYEVMHGNYSLLPNNAIQRIMFEKLTQRGGVSYNQKEQEYAEEIYQTLVSPSGKIGDQEKVLAYRQTHGYGSTDVGDVPQYVKNGFSGEIINANDESIVASFSKKIKDLVIDENKRTLYAKNAREIAIKNLDLKLCAKRHKNAYNCLV